MTQRKSQMLKIISFIIIGLCTITAFAQQLTVQSPNPKISVNLFSENNMEAEINEQYTVLHGEKSVCSNSANRVVVSFENPIPM